ncbi:MAG: hypothetical protein KDJ90_00760 [Nitratireductor sp.]|nr:hypothetical protein [Nitratireductor sp.]
MSDRDKPTWFSDAAGALAAAVVLGTLGFLLTTCTYPTPAYPAIGEPCRQPAEIGAQLIGKGYRFSGEYGRARGWQEWHGRGTRRALVLIDEQGCARLYDSGPGIVTEIRR